jgi:hypothetical protein
MTQLRHAVRKDDAVQQRVVDSRNGKFWTSACEPMGLSIPPPCCHRRKALSSSVEPLGDPG